MKHTSAGRAHFDDNWKFHYHGRVDPPPKNWNVASTRLTAADIRKLNAAAKNSAPEVTRKHIESADARDAAPPVAVPKRATRDAFAALTDLARHCWQGAHWRKTPKGPVCVKEPLPPTHLQEHLHGGRPVGLAPIAPGTDTTRIAVLDFDSHKGEVTWPAMAAKARSVKEQLEAQGMRPVAFRSSGGHGIHLIVLWDEPQDAHSVREYLAEGLLTCGLENGTKGVAQGQVEIFPKQDAVPEDGYGNMFVLPLAGQSVLLDPATFEPAAQLPAQWPKSRPVPVLQRPVREKQAPTAGGSHAEVKALLAKIPNDGPADYERYRNIIFAVHDATGGDEDGLAAANEWSARNDAHVDGFLEEKIWQYARRDRGRKYTIDTLRAEARKHENVADHFPDLGPAANDAGVIAQAGAPSKKRKLQFAPAPRAARYLINKEFKPIMFTIENLLPEGVFLLVASPKIGKSWLALQFALAVGGGDKVLGEQAKQGDALYLALEDGDRRLQLRLKKLGAEFMDEAALERVEFETRWPRVDEGGGELIEEWLVKHPDARLIIIDVLEQIRPERVAKANAYGEDYKALQALKAIAERRQVSILVVHHTRKAKSDDVMELVSGTQGLAGAADGVMVLARKRGEARGELHVMARDLEHDGAYAVDFVDARWTMVGPAEQVAKTELQELITEALREHREEGPLGPTTISRYVGRAPQTVQKTLERMARAGLVSRTATGKCSLVETKKHG